MSTATEAHPARAILEGALSDLTDLEREHRKETAALRQRLDTARDELKKTKEWKERAEAKLKEAGKRIEQHNRAAAEAMDRWIEGDEDAWEDFLFHDQRAQSIDRAINYLNNQAGFTSLPESDGEAVRVRELKSELRDCRGAHETARLNVLSEALAEAFRRSDGRIEWREETTTVLDHVVPSDLAPVIRDVLVGEIEAEDLRGALDWAHQMITKEGQADA